MCLGACIRISLKPSTKTHAWFLGKARVIRKSATVFNSQSYYCGCFGHLWVLRSIKSNPMLLFQHGPWATLGTLRITTCVLHLPGSHPCWLQGNSKEVLEGLGYPAQLWHNFGLRMPLPSTSFGGIPNRKSVVGCFDRREVIQIQQFTLSYHCMNHCPTLCLSQV